MAFQWHRLHVTVGLGADPALRAQLPALGQRASGWLLRADGKQVADLAHYEADNDPDGQGPDSNPNSLVPAPVGQIVVDAGGNSLLWVLTKRHIVTLAVFDDRLAPAPPFLGLPPGTQLPMQSVPTAVVRGPDHAYYVGELTGFPFQPGTARVHRVVPGKTPKVVATGFTNIIDIAFDRHGSLYVLELDRNGLLNPGETGALWKVGDGSKKLIASEGLESPGGLVLRGHAAYVSNHGTSAGAGTVVKIPLR